MIKIVGDFICIHESFIRKSAIDSINLSDSPGDKRCFYVSVVTKQMIYRVAFDTADDQLRYVDELLEILN